jgi:hypothetical protein
MVDRIHRGPRRAGAPVLVLVLFALALAPWAGAPAAVAAGSLDTTVLDWNAHGIEALTNAPSAATPGLGQTPPVAALHFAMLHGAVYDAVNAIDRGYQPYLANLPQAPPSASQAAAAATAAHGVLVGIVTDPRVAVQPVLAGAIVARLDGLLAARLAAAAAAEGQASVDAGIAIGSAAAQAMLAERATDGRYVPLALTPGTGPGEWRPQNASPSASDPFAWVSLVEPFTLTSPAQFRTKGPHALNTGIYAKEYNEVKTLGAATGSARTAEQTAMANFFLTNPFEMFNRLFRTIAVERGLTIAEQARLFALLNVTNADATINCWNDKVYWGFWRPITAIHEGDNDGNPRTAGDPTWAPMAGGTPPYSDHVSGYNCISGAFMHAAKAFFRTDRMDFTLVKAGTGETRRYRHFTAVCDDTIDVRVYHGVHFQAADVQGAGLGKDVAHWVNTNYFRPLR